MAIELTMPALSPTMEKGTLAKWLVAEGDSVRAGDLIAEIETDKATMEFEAVDSGTIAKLVVAEGTDDVLVGSVIALIAEAGEADGPAEARADAGTETVLANAQSAEIAPPAELAFPPARAIASAETVSDVAASAAAPEPQATPARKRVSPADRIKVSPLAARIADAKGIALSGISGSGPNGRIVRADLGSGPLFPAALASRPDVLPAAPVGAAPPAGVPVDTVKLSSMRKTIARRLTESKSSVPHFYLTARCNLDALLATRAQLNASLATSGVKLSVNDLIIKALALALEDVPEANVQFGGDQLYRFGRVDVSMAVAIEGGLVTPVLRGVGALSLSGIARQSKALAEKARDGKLLPEDYEGGTVSLSNLGMFGIDEMIPVINPPQALILGTAAGVEQPWKVDGKIALATVMAATASFDHRAIDGATGARFMAAFRALVEAPLRLCA